MTGAKTSPNVLYLITEMEILSEHFFLLKRPQKLPRLSKVLTRHGRS